MIDQIWRRRIEKRKKMVCAKLKAENMALMDKRTAMETEINSIVDRLCISDGHGLSGNLIDSERFPREQFDIPMVRAEWRHLAGEFVSTKSFISKFQ